MMGQKMKVLWLHDDKNLTLFMAMIYIDFPWNSSGVQTPSSTTINTDY